MMYLLLQPSGYKIWPYPGHGNTTTLLIQPNFLSGPILGDHINRVPLAVLITAATKSANSLLK